MGSLGSGAVPTVTVLDPHQDELLWHLVDGRRVFFRRTGPQQKPRAWVEGDTINPARKRMPVRMVAAYRLARDGLVRMRAPGKDGIGEITLCKDQIEWQNIALRKYMTEEAQMSLRFVSRLRLQASLRPFHLSGSRRGEGVSLLQSVLTSCIEVRRRIGRPLSKSFATNFVPTTSRRSEPAAPPRAGETSTRQPQSASTLSPAT